MAQVREQTEVVRRPDRSEAQLAASRVAPLLRRKKRSEPAYELVADEGSLWLRAGEPGGGVALRAAYCPLGALAVTSVERKEAGGAEGAGEEWTADVVTSLGQVRARVRFGAATGEPVRVQARFTPFEPTPIEKWPRDLLAYGSSDEPRATTGTVHTSQRGPRSGIVYGSMTEPSPLTFLYLQDFTSSTAYFTKTHTSPANSVGGTWPDLGYAVPDSQGLTLDAGVEFTLTDAFLCVVQGPAGDAVAIARTYLDLLAEIYMAMERPVPVFRDWPSETENTLLALSFSQLVSDRRRGHLYLLPYVDDRTKPPESMVQFTVLHPLNEYGEWAGEIPVLARELKAGIPGFFDKTVGSLVRWLPGEPFLAQTEDVQTHAAMDSWYLYHSLFNLARLARDGDSQASRLFRRSLPYAMKVARRFNYRWPVFYDLNTLEVIRAESAPGKGGENDVAGLYALVMVLAHELTGREEYLTEAKAAALSMEDLGFRMGYQTNTTGFGAEAMLRLAILTGDERYMGIADVCIANLIDNAWLWNCGYGFGAERSTFFGVFPLRDAPYLAAYEEAELLAKVHDYLNIGRDRLRPSVRLLLSEYTKYALDRLWAYLPAHQPAEAISAKPRVGAMYRELAVPVEDLQDGWEQSGQVGQEVYGAGTVFVVTTRHFRRLPGDPALLYCDYPMQDFEAHGDDRRGTAKFNVAGDGRGEVTLRLIQRNPNAPRLRATCRAGKPLRPCPASVTGEGHILFRVHGGEPVRLEWRS